MDPNAQQPVVPPTEPAPQPQPQPTFVSPVAQQAFTPQPQPQIQPVPQPVVDAVQSYGAQTSVQSPAGNQEPSSIQPAQPAAHAPQPQANQFNQAVQQATVAPAKTPFYKRLSKKIAIIATAILVFIAGIVVASLLIFGGSAEEKVVSKLFYAAKEKDCKAFMSLLYKNAFQETSLGDAQKECEKDKDTYFGRDNSAELLSVKKISGDKNKATVETVTKEDGTEKKTKILLVREDGKWKVDILATTEAEFAS
jgi:hypothetical protein